MSNGVSPMLISVRTLIFRNPNFYEPKLFSCFTIADRVFTVNLHHDGAFVPSPLRYLEGNEKQITDIDFEGMSFTDFREVIKC